MHVRATISSITLVLITTAVAAQDKPAAPITPKPPASVAAASKRADCGPMRRHDHGAERNAPRAKSADCPATPASSTAKGKRVHDHAKFKNQ